MKKILIALLTSYAVSAYAQEVQPLAYYSLQAELNQSPKSLIGREFWLYYPKGDFSAKPDTCFAPTEPRDDQYCINTHERTIHFVVDDLITSDDGLYYKAHDDSGRPMYVHGYHFSRDVFFSESGAPTKPTIFSSEPKKEIYKATRKFV